MKIVNLFEALYDADDKDGFVALQEKKEALNHQAALLKNRMIEFMQSKAIKVESFVDDFTPSEGEIKACFMHPSGRSEFVCVEVNDPSILPQLLKLVERMNRNYANQSDIKLRLGALNTQTRS